MPVRFTSGSKSYSGKGKRVSTKKTKPVKPVKKEEDKKETPKKKAAVKKPTVFARVKVSKRALDNIAKAAEDKKVVEILYLDKEGKRTRRMVEPYSIKKKNGTWKFYGFCLMRKAIRSFELNTILDSYILTRSFEPRFEVTVVNDIVLYIGAANG